MNTLIVFYVNKFLPEFLGESQSDPQLRHLLKERTDQLDSLRLGFSPEYLPCFVEDLPKLKAND